MLLQIFAFVLLWQTTLAYFCALGCTPNCPFQTFCDLSHQVCGNSVLGTCIDIVTVTKVIPVLTGAIPTTVTQYTATSTHYNATVTMLAASSLAKRAKTEIHSSPQAEITPNNHFKRANSVATPTTTVTVSSTQPISQYCAATSDPAMCVTTTSMELVIQDIMTVTTHLASTTSAVRSTANGTAKGASSTASSSERIAAGNAFWLFAIFLALTASIRIF
ncbi:hypothetical protein BT63DRAFT_425681 [Microthyrium microscopicum]|uniref:Extracellular membrane protein CFEM domain-containing protein n=1 Tax=Microthyrium microscopicum TaxID=703497 RepID=A0A6A6U9T4_9PEZI|nr:hypothetical protein BT63DRAFT_425681 [Microthyrium microscopicum]